MTILKYRSDIDGLRAVAVFPVLAFHYEITRWCSGGYVGVDVFFVISGFLITRIIYDGIAADTYSVAEFYQRRIRRIFPVLFTVFAATILLAYFKRFPSETTYIGTSITFAVLFVSNIYFFATGSYFDPHLASNPVLHTWSLSVEEQFYIIFPILMLAIRGFSHRTRLRIIAGAAVLSFVAAAIWVRMDAAAAFYLVHFRAWELLVGSLVAIGAFPVVKSERLREIIAATGLLGILLAIVAFDKGTTFPGPTAALPCFGAAAIIYAGGSGTTLVGRVLAWAPIRFGGLISYSLYLWHWPLFVFFADSSFDLRKKLLLSAAAITLAVASWWFVERPFRTAKVSTSRIIMSGTAAMVVTCIIAMLAGPFSNAVSPVPPRVAELLGYENYKTFPTMRDGSCFLTSGFNSLSYFKDDECLKIDPNRKNVLIVGDSHAAHLWHGYRTTLGDNVMQATASGCKPVLDLKGTRYCLQLMRKVFDDFLPQHHVDTIVVSARWIPDDVPGAIERAKDLLKHADHVIISGPAPEYDETLPRILATAVASGTNEELAATAHRRAEQLVTDDLFRSTALPDGVTYVSVYKAICAPSCRLLVGDVPIQFDYGHFTAEGSEYVTRRSLEAR